MAMRSLRSWIHDITRPDEHEPPAGSAVPSQAGQLSGNALAPAGANGSGPHPADARIDRVDRAGDRMDQAEDQLEEAEDRMQEAVDAAAVTAEETGGLGRPGRPVNRRSPFFIGMSAAAGSRSPTRWWS